MSCFRGQMNEYTSIALDRFDGKNLLCTAFFLSHCHKDHMVGLNTPAFLECLQSRDDVFLYCSEITRLLLLADEEYSQLDDYIRILEVGMTHPVLIPSNTVYKESYHVSVTLIPAGHCPGSVMFLFEGAEGVCLYTGDFRWEMNQASKMAVFQENDRIKEIKSLYVDTTFCVPGAYHIPSRNECVEAAVNLVADWLRHSPSHIVCVSCPARYGHEHFLMELAIRLDTKIHVPVWKVKIYEQISDLCGVFTSSPKEARIHACSMKAGQLTCLPRCNEKFHILSIRPSTMWFTSEKTQAKPEDLIATPASKRRMHRVCYSMHSSYSEIRDLVSYLVPKKAFPNVLPASDENMNAVQSRLNSFLSCPHKLRMKPATSDTIAQPLGTLKKLQPTQINLQPQLGTANSDELVFSSQESSAGKESPCDITTSKLSVDSGRGSAHPLPDKINSTLNIQSHPTEKEHASRALSSGSSFNAHSSYSGSAENNGEINLFSDEEEEKKDDCNCNETGANDAEKVMTNEGESDLKEEEEEEESFRLYISGDSEVSEDEDGNKCDLADSKGAEDDDAYTEKNAVRKTGSLDPNDNFITNAPHVRVELCTKIKGSKLPAEEGQECCLSPPMKQLDMCMRHKKEGNKAVDLNLQENANLSELETESKSYVNSRDKGPCSESQDLMDENIQVNLNSKSDNDEDTDEDDDIIPSSQGSPVKGFRLQKGIRVNNLHVQCSEDKTTADETSKWNQHGIEQISTLEEAITILSSSDDSESTQIDRSQALLCTHQKITVSESFADNKTDIQTVTAISDRDQAADIEKLGTHSYTEVQHTHKDCNDGLTNKISHGAKTERTVMSDQAPVSPSSANSDPGTELSTDHHQSKQLSLKRKFKTNVNACMSSPAPSQVNNSSTKQGMMYQRRLQGGGNVLQSQTRSDQAIKVKTVSKSNFTVSNADDSPTMKQTKRIKMLRESDLVDLTRDEENVIDLTEDSSSPL